MTRAFIAPAVFRASAGATLVREETAVRVDDAGAVLEVGPARDVVKAGDERVEREGVMLPGLIDMHTHLCLSAGPDPGRDAREEHVAKIAVRGAENLGRQLDAGVTTIRDVGGIGGVDLELARLVAQGELEGPEVFAAGSLLAMTGGHACFLGVEVDGEAEARKAARAQLKRGARVIKVIATGGVITDGVQPGAPQLTEGEMRAACEEAHKASRKVAAHAQGSEGIDNALRAGVDTIEHGFWLSDFALSFMTDNDRSLVPTFAATLSMRALEADLPAFVRDKLDVIEAPQRASFGKAVAQGVRVCCGTDAGTPGNPHGNLPVELQAFFDAGLGAEDCWRAATSWAAEALAPPGRGPDRGALEPGRRGDLIVVDEATFAAPGSLRRPDLVVRGGHVVRGA